MIFERAYAKLNLLLDVEKKRSDGYHYLNMIMIPIELHDQLTFKESNEVFLTSNVEIKDNSILKTIELIKKTYHIKKGVTVNLEKNIPMGAGLAGGSADIAATIRGLNQLWKLNLNDKQMEELALKLGSDTLFCLYNKPAYVYGRGEHICFLNFPKIENIYLFYPNVSVSTQKVFKKHIIDKNKNVNLFKETLNMYKNNEWSKFFNNTYNDLLKTTLTLYPKLNQIYNDLYQLDENIMMSGSGSTLFLVNQNKNIDKLLKKIEKKDIKIFKTTVKI